VHLLVIVPTKLLFLFFAPRSDWLADIAVCVFATNHETNLARWIGWDGSVCIFSHREDLLASNLQVFDQLNVQPLVLSCSK
jgi:hypothetical protein